MPRPAFANWLSETNNVTQIFLAAGQIPGLINMAGGLPDPSTWPIAELSTMAARAIADHPQDALAYVPIEGLPELRDAIAARFSAPNLNLCRDNVLITTGGIQALDLIGKVLLEEGGLIAAQTPAYLGALDAWRPRRPSYRPMHLHANDFDPEAALQSAQFAYAVPNFSNPTGQLVGVEDRIALVAAAYATETWLIEDDPYGTLYYDAAPLPRMLTMSGRNEPIYTGPVIYLGTLSKELAPGFRVGWVIAAPEMIRALVAAKQGSDMCTSGLCQRIAQDAFASGLTDRILPNILTLYRDRRDALCQAMTTHLSDFFDWQVPSGGMFVWATARDPGLNTDHLLAQAMKHGVCITPSSVFDPEGRNRSSIRINFTLNGPEKLNEGVIRLAAALTTLTNAA
ncbi:MAG: PLP-dependent aminotransferase family protein [Cypionkella sp.]|uniref:aminotransferase-like domain-containing protein n=1 Tax=Cypionkella sp. TaxID=2811411 RepID=UPI00261400CA|nr:PLP-dependent aminotransferase family protein [Cypionkella sp.]MDB5658101.1 PLP-dependent aminotransferase family protein [Cypionkella sp.]